MGLIAKPDERNELESGSKRDAEKEKDGVLAGKQFKMNWVGEVNERHSDSDENRHRPSGIERADKWCIKRMRKQRGIRSEHLQVCYLHLRHRASRTSKWEEQSRPQQACQPLMFSHHTDGHHEQLWCARLWAFEVIFCYLTYFVCVRIGFSRMLWGEAVALAVQINVN